MKKIVQRSCIAQFLAQKTIQGTAGEGCCCLATVEINDKTFAIDLEYF